MKIDQQKDVTMTYELLVYGKDESVHSLDKRDSKNPIEFVFGRGLVLPAVEKELENKFMGFKKSILLYPKDAYGEWKPELETWTQRDKFPPGTEIRLGMKFQTQGLDSDLITVMVKDIKEDEILLDGNHPLAGLKIQFDIEVLRVREATEEELLSGEVRKLMH